MVAIMQPYFLPYLGYFQLMKAADTFVIYDDVDYINRGWINRNNILVNGQKNLITVPLQKASQNKKINEIEVFYENKWRTKLLKTIELNYKKASQFNPTFELVNKIVQYESYNLAEFLVNSLKEIKDFLKLETKIVETSSVFDNSLLKKESRLIDICIQLEDENYLNPIGGAEIYTKAQFAEKGINLNFLEMTPRAYDQVGNLEFVPYLSILDVLMNNEVEFIKAELLKDFRIS